LPKREILQKLSYTLIRVWWCGLCKQQRMEVLLVDVSFKKFADFLFWSGKSRFAILLVRRIRIQTLLKTWVVSMRMSCVCMSSVQSS